MGVECPLKSIPESDLGIKPQGNSDLGRKSGHKPLPAVLDGMDKAEALAYVSRLFDAAEVGAVLWGDALLIKRFISQCSRTGSKATQDGYRFEIREFTRWGEFNHPNLHLREINPAFCQDWVDELRREVEAKRMKPRTFNRRIAAISSLYRWAAEPCRSPVTGVPRNPMPPRSMLMASKSTRPLSQEQFGLLMAVITRSANSSKRQRATTSKGTTFLVLRSPESPQIPCNNKGCNCFLSSRSYVRITQVALLTARGEQLIHFALTCNGWIEHSPF